MLKLTAVLFMGALLSASANAQSGLVSIGEGYSYSPETKKSTDAFDFLANFRKLGITAQTDRTFKTFIIGNRQYPFRHSDTSRVQFFLTQSIKKSDIPKHPWFFQPGAGLDLLPIKRDRLFIACSEVIHLKTAQLGFACATQNYFDIGHNLSIRASYTRTTLDTPKGPSILSTQIKVGLNYSWRF